MFCKIVRTLLLFLVLLITLISQLLLLLNVEKRYKYDNDGMIGTGTGFNTTTTGLEKEQKQNTRGVEFSMCTIVKNEKNNLLEWTAYHYYMINMRHLVLCDDLNSVTSPHQILNNWKEVIKIDIWGVDEFSPPRIINNDTTYKSYETRQLHCLRKCMHHFKQHNRTWVAFIDADEYLAFNPVAEDDDKCMFKKSKNVSSASAFEIVYDNKRKCEVRNLRDDNKTISMEFWKKRLVLPSPESKTIAEYMQGENDIWNKLNCHVLPRLLFGGSQEKDAARLNRYIPPGFHAENFTTLSFFRHGRKGFYFDNRWGKCIVDVSRMDIIRFRTPHYLAPGCGELKQGWVEHDISLLRVNHYLGSKKLFLSKDDPRRSEEMFRKRSTASRVVNYEMQGWLPKFVDLVGEEQAVKLLDGVGGINV